MATKIIFNISVNFATDSEVEKFCNVVKKIFSNDYQIAKINSIEQTSESTTKELTVKDALDLYLSDKNLKMWSCVSYKNAFRQVFKDLEKSYVSEISEEKFNISTQNLSNNTKAHYITRIVAVLRWLRKKRIINSIALENLKENLKVCNVEHRAALDCCNWISISDAKVELTKLFLIIKQQNTTNNFLLIVLHFILATRVSETKNVIDGFDASSEQNYIFIDSKRTKKDEKLKYRVPITSFIKKILLKIAYDNKKLDKIYFTRKIARILYKKNEYKNRICNHGTRAIFRTTIDFLTLNMNVSSESKEMYLDHVSGSKIFRTYQRQDYFLERVKIQCLYARFIFECAGLDDYLNSVKEYVEYFNIKYPDYNFK